MTTFDSREDAFENRFAHEEAMRFKAHARRNVKLGLWAAAMLGKSGAEADAYAQALVTAEVNGGAAAVVAKLAEDFGHADMTMSEGQISHHMDTLLAEAQVEMRVE